MKYLLIALAFSFAASAQTIPTQLTPIILPLNGVPVRVTKKDVERYRCAAGRLVATIDMGGRAAQHITLRCIAD